QTVLCEPANDMVDFRFRADIHALRRFVEDKELWFGREPAGQCNFLLVAAAQTARGSLSAVGFHAEGAKVVKDERVFGTEPEPGSRKQAAMNGHRDVVGDWHFQNHAVPAAVFGHVGNAKPDGVLWRTDGDPLAVEE